MICDPWQVAVVPFPFSEARGNKVRPALVLSQSLFNQEGHTILAMITSRLHRAWPGDSVIQDLQAAGLKQSCIVRLKLFTLDNRLILDCRGEFSDIDREAVASSLGMFFAAAPTPANHPPGGASSIHDRFVGDP